MFAYWWSTFLLSNRSGGHDLVTTNVHRAISDWIITFTSSMKISRLPSRRPHTPNVRAAPLWRKVFAPVSSPLLSVATLVGRGQPQLRYAARLIQFLFQWLYTKTSCRRRLSFSSCTGSHLKGSRALTARFAVFFARKHSHSLGFLLDSRRFSRFREGSRVFGVFHG